MMDDWLLFLLAMAPPLGLHPLEHVVNVHWDEGLAVEFFSKDNGDNSTGE